MHFSTHFNGEISKLDGDVLEFETVDYIGSCYCYRGGFNQSGVVTTLSHTHSSYVNHGEETREFFNSHIYKCAKVAYPKSVFGSADISALVLLEKLELFDKKTNWEKTCIPIAAIKRRRFQTSEFCEFCKKSVVVYKKESVTQHLLDKKFEIFRDEVNDYSYEEDAHFTCPCNGIGSLPENRILGTFERIGKAKGIPILARIYERVYPSGFPLPEKFDLSFTCVHCRPPVLAKKKRIRKRRVNLDARKLDLETKRIIMQEREQGTKQEKETGKPEKKHPILFIECHKPAPVEEIEPSIKTALKKLEIFPVRPRNNAKKTDTPEKLKEQAIGTAPYSPDIFPVKRKNKGKKTAPACLELAAGKPKETAMETTPAWTPTPNDPLGLMVPECSGKLAIEGPAQDEMNKKPAPMVDMTFNKFDKEYIDAEKKVVTALCGIKDEDYYIPKDNSSQTENITIREGPQFAYMHMKHPPVPDPKLAFRGPRAWEETAKVYFLGQEAVSSFRHFDTQTEDDPEGRLRRPRRAAENGDIHGLKFGFDDLRLNALKPLKTVTYASCLAHMPKAVSKAMVSEAISEKMKAEREKEKVERELEKMTKKMQTIKSLVNEMCETFRAFSSTYNECIPDLKKRKNRFITQAHFYCVLERLEVDKIEFFKGVRDVAQHYFDLIKEPVDFQMFMDAIFSVEPAPISSREALRKLVAQAEFPE